MRELVAIVVANIHPLLILWWSAEGCALLARNRWSFSSTTRKNAVHGTLHIWVVLHRIVYQPFLQTSSEGAHRRIFTCKWRKLKAHQPSDLLVCCSRQCLQTIDLLCSNDAAFRRGRLRALHQWPELRHRNEGCDCDLAQELQHLERQVRWPGVRRDENRVDELAQRSWELRSSHDIEFDHKQGRHDQIPPEFASLELTEYREQDKSRAGADVVHADVLDSSEDVVTDSLRLSPLQNLRAKAIVCKAFRRVDECIPGQLQAYVNCLDIRTIRTGSFVWVELDSPVQC
jgi:hypothetical protein